MGGDDLVEGGIEGSVAVVGAVPDEGRDRQAGPALNPAAASLRLETRPGVRSVATTVAGTGGRGRPLHMGRFGTQQRVSISIFT